MRRIVCFASVLFFAQTAQATPRSWENVKRPSKDRPESIGGYSAGCVRGAQALPMRGPGFVVVRPERRRHYGHPTLIRYLKRLSRRSRKARLPRMRVGDLGQPLGGPAPNGHASHQTGLDVDIWFGPKNAPMVDLANKVLNPKWSKGMEKRLRFAADDPAVSRIFVNPVIKKHLCETAGSERDYLRKVRPWYGHHKHFHVRLRCPKGSKSCEEQGPLPPGDGCSAVDWWLDEKAQAERRQKRATYQSKVGGSPKLPERCMELLR